MYKITFFLSFIILLCSNATAQDNQITGTVYDEQNMPLPGASIVVVGTTTATLTDISGNYSLTIPAGITDAKVQISYMGYISQTVAVSGQSTIDIKLDPDPETLEEIVVVGYGTQKKKDVTGAVSSANLEPFRNSPNVNILQSLQGTVPGLNIGQVNSAGGTPSIQVRGQSTLGGNTGVLIVLDGIIYSGSLSSLNPNDIESVDVLKDASAKAIYGSQAGNGVMLITTKKGKRGKPVITYNWSYASQTPTVKLRPLNREEFLEKVKDLNYDKAFLAPEYTTANPDFNVVEYVDFTMRDENNNLRDNNFDWWGAGTNTGDIIKHDLTVSGGSDNSTYLISAGVTDQSGFIINDTYKRKNIRVNLETKATDWLTLGVQSFAAFNDYSGAEPDLDALIRQAPFLTPYDDNGDLVASPTQTNVPNPFLTYDVLNHSTRNEFFGNFYGVVNFPFLKGLSYRINYGNNYNVTEDFGASKYEAGLTGQAYKNHGAYYDYTLDNIISYRSTIKKHDFDVTFVYGAMEKEYNSTESWATDIPNLILGYNSLEQGVNQFASSSAWKEAYNYQIGRLNYKFDDKYLVTATLRRDGFSGNARNEKWAMFPSGALGWVASNESFLKGDTTLSYLKLTAGYGANGNTGGRYSSLAGFSRSRQYVFGDGGTSEFGQSATSLESPNLRWEKTQGVNFRVDFGVLKDRIMGTIDYYETKTNDLLYNVSLPSIVGITTIKTNVGDLRNKGLEIQLTSHNIKGEDFQWSTTANFSTNKNKIVSLLGIDADGDGQEDDLEANGLFIGESAGTLFGYKPGPIYQIGDDIPEGYSPGTQSIVDTNGDGEITADDRVILGTSLPAYRVGLLNTFSYKGFSLNVFFNSVQGGKDNYLGNVLPVSVGGALNDNAIRYNYFSAIDYWSPRNPNGEFPRSLLAPALNATQYRDRSFIRLQDITLGYRFDRKVLDQIGLSDLNIFVSGKNLATWTKWQGWDPETGQGLDENGRPVMKSYSVGMNITF